MIAPVFKLISRANIAEITADQIVRCFAARQAPEGTKPPYVVWFSVGGEVHNNVDAPASADHPNIQFSIFAISEDEAELVAKQVRSAIENDCYVITPPSMEYEQETGLTQIYFETSWII